MITKPPAKRKIEEVINKGGASPSREEPNSEIITTPLRISKGLMNAINEQIKGPYGAKKQSRNSFIISAIINELERFQNDIKKT